MEDQNENMCQVLCACPREQNPPHTIGYFLTLLGFPKQAVIQKYLERDYLENKANMGDKLSDPSRSLD